MISFAAITVAMTTVFAAGLGAWLPVIFALVMILNAIITLRRAKRQREEHQAKQREQGVDHRTHEVRERMRRLAEERRRALERHGETTVAAAPPTLHAPEPAPASPPPGRYPPVDPFGDSPLGRLLQELQKKVEQPPAPPPVVVHREPAPPLAPPAPPVFVSSEEASPDGIEGPTRGVVHRHDAPTVARRRRHPLLSNIHDHDALRRSLVHREVLGPPAALR